MYFTFVNAIRALLNFDTGKRDEERKEIRKEDHSYHRLNIADRAPCPGLNALANQGYLPRDGKNITPARCEAALMEALHMSGTVAHALTNTLKPVLHEDGTFDLVDVRIHNVVEHDNSFTRLDYRQGDNYTLQPQMLQAMLGDAKGGPLTLKTLATTYIRRKKEHRESGGEPLGVRLWFVDLLIKVGFINAEATGHPSQQQVALFYKEERLEDYILQNPVQRSLHGLLWKAVKLWWFVHVG